MELTQSRASWNLEIILHLKKFDRLPSVRLPLSPQRHVLLQSHDLQFYRLLWPSKMEVFLRAKISRRTASVSFEDPVQVKMTRLYWNVCLRS